MEGEGSSRLVNAPVRARDAILTLGSMGGLAALMAFRGDVVHPRGTDTAHPLGHYASLWHSGHVPGGVFLGLAFTLLVALGVLGLLGDSPLDVRGDEVPWDLAPSRWWKRPGAWVVAGCAALYLPTAGAYGLWDPWETHYAEVAREVLARDDWITLWWGTEGWFMSKPVLVFWLGALGMGAGSTFGLPFWSDQGPGAHEWCIRVPVVLLAIAAVYAMYRAVANAWGPRAGACCALVLATCPQWFFIAHQNMTDMPFVAALVLAMSFLTLAVTASPIQLVTPRALRIGRRRVRLSGWHLAVGALVLVVAPQIAYLLTRPVTLGCGDDPSPMCTAALAASRVGPLQFPIERFEYGSAGNSVPGDAAASVPGSPAWQDRFSRVPFATSPAQGLAWLAIAAAVLVSMRRERRAQALCFAMVYLFSAISFLGKGPAGVGVPEIVLLGFMVTTGRWSILRRVRLLQGVAIFALCGLPWYVAIYARLGGEYIDRFVVHDLLNRAVAGVHGDTGTFRYFVAQLGYGLFPWIGLLPLGLAAPSLFMPNDATRAQRDTVLLALLWFLATFTLFSLMVTKFHHYILPAVPAAALLIGLVLHALVRTSSAARPWITAGIATALLVYGAANFVGAWDGRVSAVAPFALPHGHRALGFVCVTLASVLVAWNAWKTVPDAPSGSARAWTAAGLGAAVVVGLVAIDLATVHATRPAGFEHLVHLFTYNYQRVFPVHSFDLRAPLAGFGVAAFGSVLLVSLRRSRHTGAQMLALTAVLFALWGLDQYMVDLSAHWSQRGLFERYYARRGTRSDGTPDAIAAYGLNWKGENFYTGNRAAQLECGPLPFCGTTLATWSREHRGEHVFFITEHSRASGLITQLRRDHREARTLTDEQDNVMFVLLEAWL